MLYDAGCDTFEKMQLKKYKDMLSHKAARGLKYARNLDSPVPRENAEAIVVRCRSLICAWTASSRRPTYTGILQIFHASG